MRKMALSMWVGEVERPDARVRAYLGNIYETDPDLPENRDQNIQDYSWNGEANTWLNNLTNDPPSTEQAKTLSFLVAHANALDLSRARGRWDDEGDEPRLTYPELGDRDE